MTKQNRPLDALLAPRSVAVVGASRDTSRMSGLILEQLRRSGYEGQVYPVNPKYDSILGYRCYASISELADTPPDVAIIYLRADAAVETVETCARMGVKALVVMSAGFAELGEEGRRLERRMTDVARDAGMALCGPNTAGMANFLTGFVAYGASAFAGVEKVNVGKVAIVSSSGGLGSTLFSYCRARHVGISHLIGMGNEAVTHCGDYIDALVDDPDVGVIVALIESLRDPDAFFAAADRAVLAGVPIVAMKQGRTDVGRRAIQTHTAALSGSAEIFEAACRQHGIITVRELRALADQAMLLTRLEHLRSYRVGVLSLPGGGTSLLADAAREAGFELPRLGPETVDRLRPLLPSIATPSNPLDPTAGFARDGQRLEESIRVFASDPSFDLVTFFQAATEPEYSRRLASSVVAAATDLGKPLLAVWESGPELEEGAWRELHAGGLPFFSSAQDAFSALAAHRWYAGFVRSRSADSVPRTSFEPPEGQDRLTLSSGVDSVDGARVLDGLGIARPREVLFDPAAPPPSLDDSWGPRVVVKVARPRIDHKTDVGAVRVGVPVAELSSAVEGMVTDVEGALGGTRVELVQVQQMMSDGLEVLIGGRVDPHLGPTVTVGLGGALTELMSDVSHRLAPLRRCDAVELLDEIHGMRLLDGHRGSAALDRESLIDVIVRVGWFVDAFADSRVELELNPVIVHAEGSVAVDVVLTMNATVRADHTMVM